MAHPRIDPGSFLHERSISLVQSPDPRFNQAAKPYVEKAHFSPGRVAGRAVRVRFQIPVEFRLPTRH